MPVEVKSNHRPPLTPSLSASSSQSTHNTINTASREHRHAPGAEPTIMPKPLKNRPHRSDASSTSEGLPATMASAGASFSQPSASEPEEREERRHNRLGYQRTTVACSHCRRRKIRCEPSENEPSGRCVKCIKWDKECIFEAADQSASVARSSRPRRSELNSQSPSTSATSTNLHDQSQFDQSSHDPEMHSASPHGYHPFGDAHNPAQWFQQPYNAPRVGYQHPYGPGGPPYSNGGGMPAMDTVSSYSTPDEQQLRRYSIPYHAGQPSAAMLDSSGQASPGSSYVTSAGDNRWDGPSPRPSIYPGFVNQTHMYPNLAPHELNGIPQQAPGPPQGPPHEGTGTIPLWNPLPPSSMPGTSRAPFINGHVPNWDISMQYDSQYHHGHPPHQYQH